MEKTNPVRRLIKAIRNSRSGERQGDKTAKTISVPQLIRAIRKLPSDESINDSRVWYTTQKQHWLGWLREYNGPGGYGRIPGQNRDARYAYNHIVNPQMLAYLNHASGASPEVEQEMRRS